MEFDVEHSKAEVRDILRSFIGRHAMSVEFVAERTGISPGLIYSHMAHDGSMPNAAHLRLYAIVLGPEFLNALFGPLGFASYRTNPKPYCMHGAMTRLMQAGYQWSGIIEDDKITHDEEPIAIPLWRSLGEFGFEYAAALERRIAA